MYGLILYLIGFLTGAKNKPETNPITNEPSQKNTQAPTSAIVIFNSSPSITDQQIARDKKGEEREESKFFYQKLGLFVLSIYTFFTFLMYCANQKAANAAKTAASTAQSTLIKNDDWFKADHRAWVAVSDIVPSPERTPWGFTITFKNTGRTPARSFAVKLAGEPVAKGAIASGKEEFAAGHGLIPPDGVFHMGLSTQKPYNWKAYDLIVHGQLFYDSVFGHNHWTKFCYYFVPRGNLAGDGDFAPCNQGNEVDDNEP